jgi:hypothetical protein
MKKQISIALAAGLLMAGASAASADIQQPPTEHNIYSDHTASAYIPYIQKTSRNRMSPPVSSENYNLYSGHSNGALVQRYAWVQ